MRQFVSLLFATLMAISTLSAMSKSEEMALIRGRYSDFLASTAPSASQIKGYLDSLDTKSGAWRDIDYASTIGSGWRTKEHTLRTMHMAQFYVGCEGDNELFTRKQLSEAIHSVWEYWFREKPWCSTNWFPNKLSCPREMGTSFMLMQDEMSERQQRCAVEVFNKSELAKTGSNLIYVATTALMQGLFENNAELVQRAVDAMSGTIFLAKRGQEGIQPDYSYHLHGALQQFGTYGREAMGAITPFCGILKGTSFAFSDEQIDILAKFFSQGFRWVLWRGYMDMIASGRQYGHDMFRDKALHIMESARLVADAATPEQRALIEAMIMENEGVNTTALIGQKHFYSSDCVVHRQPTWVASLKMHSTRVKGSEMSSNDNRLGFFSPDGALYIYVDGGDFENSVLLWDWRKVPGITCYQSDESLESYATSKTNKKIVNNSNFVGSCGDGISGISTMVLNREGLKAHKSWIMTPEYILCLGSDIGDASGESLLTTSIDQRRQRGDLLMLNKGRRWSVIDSSEVAAKSGLRLYHNRVGYILLDESECEVRVDHRLGDWFTITRAAEPQVDSANMVTISLLHKSQPSSYQYLILPDMSAEQVAAFDLRRIEIVYNNKDIHMVRDGDCIYATIFVAGSYRIDKSTAIEAKRAGVYMLRSSKNGWDILAHDPTQELNNEQMRNNLIIN